MLLIKGIPSSLWWGECVCARMQGLSSTSFNPDLQISIVQRCAGHSLAKGDTKPPVPFRKDKTQVTDVGTIVLSMAFSLLFFCSSAENRKTSCYSLDTLLSCSLYSPPKSTQDGVYIKGVSSRPVQSLQSFKSQLLAAQCMLENPLTTGIHPPNRL